MDEAAQDDLFDFCIILMIAGADILAAAAIVGFLFGIGYGLVFALIALAPAPLYALHLARKHAKRIKEEAK